MKTYSKTGPALLAATALIALGGTARAQTQPAAQSPRANPPVSGLMIAPPTPDADALAAEMRVLASDPKNVEALTKAGELTLKLGDPTAAANLFARAEKVQPNNPTLKADEAAVLVHMERPGEALRLFGQAEKMGADPQSFAAERGLAYDLLGYQAWAQRDYRLALKADPDNAELMRRYALSLGISGDRKQALAAIDPLVRRQDHAGWRDRAFIFAMTGDADQAKKIATAMLPDDMAGQLAPFFDRLNGLSASEKAFAVHFGDLQVTPQRLADARMAPALPALQPEPVPQVAQADVPAEPTTRKKRDKHRRDRNRDSRPSEAASVTPTPAPIPTSTTLPAATPAPSTTPLPAPSPSSQQLASAAPTRPVQTPSTTPPARSRAPVQRDARPPAAAPTPRPGRAARATRPDGRVGEEDHILANIMSGVSGAAPGTADQPAPATAAPNPAPTPRPAAAEAKQLEAANLAAIKQAAADKAAAKAAAEAKRKEDAAKKAAAAKAAAKKAADEKAAAAKKAADEKAAAEKRAKEKEAKANPARIWVQVAGGANEDDLSKAWAAVKAKAPEAFKGKSGWSTPLRATNRVLAGPFKTDDAAQDFVNDLAKKGIHAFPFTSEKGQKVDKLPAK
ncbi:MAG: SPOR domain-containing protein [Sphingomonas sp.]